MVCNCSSFDSFISKENLSTNFSELNPEDEAMGLLWQVGMGYIIILICLLGICGHIVSLSVLSNNFFTSVTYTYIRWMSFSDMLGMLFTVIQQLHFYLPLFNLGNSYATTFYFAHTSLPLINTFLGSSSIIITLMTIERYLSVCHPHQNIHSWYSQRYIRASVLVIFILCFICYLPTAFEFTVEQSETSSGEYVMVWKIDYVSMTLYRKLYGWCRAILFRFIPLLVVLILNTMTLIRYRKRVISRRHSSRNSSRENGCMVILATTAILYVVCLTPMPIAHNLLDVDNLKGAFSFQIYIVIGNILEITNAAANFYVYCLASRDFRHHISRLCGRPCKYREHGQSISFGEYSHNSLQVLNILREAEGLPVTQEDSL